MTHDRGVILYCMGHSYKAQQNPEGGLRENVLPKVSSGKEMSQSISEGTSKDSVRILKPFWLIYFFLKPHSRNKCSLEEM